MESHLTLAGARRIAISHSLFQPTTLQGAIDRLGFVQADPIRSPARAQDLILRHRVDGYRAGDLERHYASLDIEEDYLYAYGFVARRTWNLLHPRAASRLSRFEQKVLDVVRASGEVHPSDLEAHLGRRRVVNAWGGYSKATTQALEQLHYRGLVRIARRERGIRVYKPVSVGSETAAAHERLRGLVMDLANIFAPASLKGLQAIAARFNGLGEPRKVIGELVQSGALRKGTIDGHSYAWPAGAEARDDVPRTVRLLAPFDPVVWDRARFERFWGWVYRFEAYTPVKKRVRGYYAMPMLWGDRFVGWANVGAASAVGALGATGLSRPPSLPLTPTSYGATGAGRLEVDVGFVNRRPRDRGFSRELDAEIARMEGFLSPTPPHTIHP